ncbi:MAG: hypothetical protein GC164_00930 [Phycisphaera sp.]|nr:hypothetical protein [Phycisphaera sp.]
MGLTAYLEGARVLVRGALGVSRATVGVDRVGEQTFVDRKRICASCEAASPRKATGIQGLKLLTPMSRCKDCHCLIQLKTSLATERCPRGKW